MIDPDDDTDVGSGERDVLNEVPGPAQRADDHAEISAFAQGNPGYDIACQVVSPRRHSPILAPPGPTRCPARPLRIPDQSLLYRKNPMALAPERRTTPPRSQQRAASIAGRVRLGQPATVPMDEPEYQRAVRAWAVLIAAWLDQPVATAPDQAVVGPSPRPQTR
jgi:hypothetical protein